MAAKPKRLNPKSNREGLYLDTSEWETAVRQLVNLGGVDLGKLIKDEAKLLVRDCIKLTPPTTGGAGVVKENLKKQEQSGKNAIIRDIRRIVKDVTELDMYKNPKIKKWLNAAFKNHNWKLVLDIVGGGVGAGMQVPDNIHEQHRNKRGRVQRTVPKFWVKDTAKRKKLMTYAGKVFERIGKAKAGWLPAARRLKLAKRHYIKFISRHSGRGMVADNTKGTKNPYVIVANMEEHAQKHDKGGKIMAVALKLRTQVIRSKIEKLLKIHAQNFNNRSQMAYNPKSDQR